MKTIRGFTLIELLIAVAVVAILATVAMGGYGSQVRKGKRAEGKTALMALLQAQEKYRANCPQYASGLGAAESCAAGAYTLVSPTKTATGLYDLAITSADATGFAATATAPAGSAQAKDTGCTTLTLTLAAGNTTTEPAKCW